MATAQTAYSVGRKDGEKREGDPYTYSVGFGNSFASEAIPGTLPVGQNAPQKVAWGLYAEQVSAMAEFALLHPAHLLVLLCCANLLPLRAGHRNRLRRASSSQPEAMAVPYAT